MSTGDKKRIYELESELKSVKRAHLSSTTRHTGIVEKIERQLSIQKEETSILDEKNTEL